LRATAPLMMPSRSPKCFPLSPASSGLLTLDELGRHPERTRSDNEMTKVWRQKNLMVGLAIPSKKIPFSLCVGKKGVL
jgi:hypothetical protein